MKNILLENFICDLPKAELHLHIEGSFEPELMFKIANRNDIKIKYDNVEAIKKAYQFNNLQEFLDIYYEGANVLITEQDFYDLTWAYLLKIKEENVLHTEIFFDPQTHTDRGVAFETVITGIYKALQKGKDEFGISFKLIMSFLRHLDEAAAFKTLEECLPFKDWIFAVGLDSSEVGNPPAKFERVFEAAIKEGFVTVAHAGEEGPASYIWEAINLLKISRLDHGNRCLEDEKLVELLAEKQMALTLCPLSNLELKVINKMENHPILEMMNKNLLVTINSDDPAYFGGYMNENYLAIANALNLSKTQIATLAKNSFEASFLSQKEKEILINKVEEYLKRN